MRCAACASLTRAQNRRAGVSFQLLGHIQVHNKAAANPIVRMKGTSAGFNAAFGDGKAEA